MLRYIIKLIRLMHSDTDPRQISLGFSLGMILGLTPLYSLHNLIVLLVVLLFRANISASILSLAVFSILAFVLNPIFHQIGFFILIDIDSIEGLWTSLYNAPLIPYTCFNNTVVMGSLVFSLLAFYPLYWGGRIMVVQYRETFMERFNRWKIVQLLKASSLYRWYSRYSSVKG